MTDETAKFHERTKALKALLEAAGLKVVLTDYDCQLSIGTADRTQSWRVQLTQSWEATDGSHTWQAPSDD